MSKTAIDAVSRLARQVVWAEDYELDAITLALAASHVQDKVTTIPRVLVTGLKESGKTTILDLAFALASNAEDVSLATSFGLRATFSDNRDQDLSIIVDEVDTIFGSGGTQGKSNQLRPILCQGYRKRATLKFASGQSVVTIPIYASGFMAGIGDHCVPDDLLSRCIHVFMKSKPENVKLIDSGSPDFEAYTEALIDPFHAQMRSIADDVKAYFREYPVLHLKLTSRKGQIWGSLFAVAHAVGEDWPQRCRIAFEKMACDGSDDPLARLIPEQRLLVDMAAVFQDSGEEYLPVRKLAELLADNRDRGDYYEKLGNAIYWRMTDATGVPAAKKHLPGSENLSVTVRYASDCVPAAAKLLAELAYATEPEQEDIELGIIPG